MSNVGEKIQLSRDEFRNISRCLGNEEFRKLFAEYCEELSDPANRKQYEDELKVLEAERGYDVKFIKPLPGYVIKSVADGKTKAFVNVCHCDLIGKPASQGSTNENGQKGLKWSIPYAQCQPRKDYDNKKIECVVYDVVFHYDTLHLANSNAGFRKLVTDTAIDAVESAFKVSLDKVNLKFPKLQYKGVPKMTVIRQKLNNFNSQQNDNIIDKLYPVRKESKTLLEDKTANKENIIKPKPEPAYATPRYKLVHRKEVEYHELTEERDAKVNAATPKELVLVIELPLLKSANDCTLNVTSKEVHLISEKPAKYKLEVSLPYEVAEKDGSAKFNTDEKTLTVVLPVVKARRAVLNDINGANNVESNERKLVENAMEREAIKKPVDPTKLPKGPQIVSSSAAKRIVFPKFSANKMDNIFAFTINVRNVDPNSIELQKGVDTVSCRFTNIGSGFFPCYYVFFARFPNTTVAEVQHEEWDNNFILQVVLEDSQVSCYYAGADENDLVEYSIMDDISEKINNFGKEIEDDSLCIAVSKNAAKQERKSQLSIQIKTKSDSEGEDESEEVLQPETKTDRTKEREDVMAQRGNENNSTSTEVEMKTVEEQEESEKRDNVHEGKKSKKHSRRKNKKRSLSESCCDQLQAMVGNEIPKVEQKSSLPAAEGLAESAPDNATVSVSKQRKARSVSESFTSTSTENAGADSASVDNLTALIQFNRKYKGILKRSSFERSISECSSVDDHYYMGTSVDASSMAGSVDQATGELSESCRKHVRFNDLIKTKLFRSNTSILGQKKKNAKKNESKRRALTRRLSEGESTDNDDKDHVNGNEAPISAVHADNEHDSGVSLDSDVGLSAEKEVESDAQDDQYQSDSTKPIDINHNAGGKKFSNSKKDDGSKKAKPSNRKNAKHADSNNIEFKSDMIFDIEM